MLFQDESNEQNGQQAVATGFKCRNFHLIISKNLFTVSVVEHRHKLPREVVESHSLELFKTLMDAAQSNLL